MKALLIVAAAATAAMSAVPASAQSWVLVPQVRNEIRQDINQIERQIVRAEQRRTISRREARNLKQEATELRQTYRRYNRNGLSRAEVRVLEREVNELRRQLRLEQRDWDRRRG
jgi:predicted RNase H-like nuclease (RuvC/YqgF family)